MHTTHVKLHTIIQVSLWFGIPGLGPHGLPPLWLACLCLPGCCGIAQSAAYTRRLSLIFVGSMLHCVVFMFVTGLVTSRPRRKTGRVLHMPFGNLSSSKQTFNLILFRAFRGPSGSQRAASAQVGERNFSRHWLRWQAYHPSGPWERWHTCCMLTPTIMQKRPATSCEYSMAE